MSETTRASQAKVQAGERSSTIERAVADIAAWSAVIVVDDEDRENEGDLIFAAGMATPELVASWCATPPATTCVPLDGDGCDRLGLPPMYSMNQDKHGTAYTVTVDARLGVGTGIGAADRAAMRLLADPKATANDFTRPGHVVHVRARRAVCCAARPPPGGPAVGPGPPGRAGTRGRDLRDRQPEGRRAHGADRRAASCR